MRGTKNVLYGLTMALGLGAAGGCVTELGDAEEEIAAEQGALTADGGAATAQKAAMQTSTSTQYLQLQSQMQNENRAYTALSNILKTKSDTTKNAISNVR